MPKISVVVITLNEEANIGRCLDSVKEVADEIVVVDSFSTDNTEKAVKEKGNLIGRNIMMKAWSPRPSHLQALLWPLG